jgi:hypothetical protein
VGTLCKFNTNPGRRHWNKAKHILHYIISTQDLALTYSGSSINPRDSSIALVHAYSDSDYAGNVDNHRSTNGYAIMMAGRAISWSSKLQPIVAQSTGEAKYVSSAIAGMEIAWICNFLAELGFAQGTPTVLSLDNTSSIQWNDNPTNNSRTKHIHSCYHYTHLEITRCNITVIHCPTQEMVADILTKNLSWSLHEKFVQMLGLVQRSSGSIDNKASP